MSENHEAGDHADLSARLERNRKMRINHFPAEMVDYGREIPPRLNPDVAGMVGQVKAAYASIQQRIDDFYRETEALVESGKLDASRRSFMVQQYQDLKEALNAAQADPTWELAPEVDSTNNDGQNVTAAALNRFADHAKHVYAVGARDIAGLQYHLAELSYIGQLDSSVNERMQWQHCLPMWETLYQGTTSAVRDESTWDGGWDWDDNTYSDGRQVMVQVRLQDWADVERRLPLNSAVCGDGPVNEHPRGSVCRIAPVEDPDKFARFYAPAEINLEQLVAQLPT